MKVTKIKITDLVYALEAYIEQGTEYLDVEILPTKNTIKFSESHFDEEQTEIYSA